MDGYSRNYAALGKWDENAQCYRYVKSKSSKNFPDNFLEVEGAESGKYVLYTKYLWSRNRNSGSGVVSVYSLSPASITEAKVSSDKFLNDIMFDHASRNPRRKNLQGPNDWLCSDILLNSGGFSYFVANVDQSSPSKYGVTVQEA